MSACIASDKTQADSVQQAATELVRSACARLGLSVVAVTKAGAVQEHELYMAWLAAGHAGELTYLHRDAEARRDVREIGRASCRERV